MAKAIALGDFIFFRMFKDFSSSSSAFLICSWFSDLLIVYPSAQIALPNASSLLSSMIIPSFTMLLNQPVSSWQYSMNLRYVFESLDEVWELNNLLWRIVAISARELSSMVCPDVMSGVMFFANCIMPRSFVMFTTWSSFISGKSSISLSFLFRVLLNILM